MKIQEQDIYHGPALMQIVEHSSFKALNKADGKYGHYLVNTDKRLWFKYASRDQGPWSFTVQPRDITAMSEDFRSTGSTFLVLVCGHKSICCLDRKEFEQVVDMSINVAQWLKVEAPEGRQMRVTGSKNGKNPILIPHNRFPHCIFP